MLRSNPHPHPRPLGPSKGGPSPMPRCAATSSCTRPLLRVGGRGNGASSSRAWRQVGRRKPKLLSPIFFARFGIIRTLQNSILTVPNRVCTMFCLKTPRTVDHPSSRHGGRLMKRHDLTDEPWTRVELRLASRDARAGRPAAHRRSALHGIVWIPRAGAPWRGSRWGAMSPCLARSNPPAGFATDRLEYNKICNRIGIGIGC